MFSHTSPSKSVCDFPDVVWFFFYKLLKFDIDVPFYKRGHNFEREAKLNSILEHLNTRANELEMFSLICSLIVSDKPVYQD